jgi:hypothetical protein
VSAQCALAQIPLKLAFALVSLVICDASGIYG